MKKELFGVEIYALMRNADVIGYFDVKEDKLVLNLIDGININTIPYIIRLNYKDNLDAALEKWVSSRLLQKDRIGIRSILNTMGISKYNKHDLFLHSHASMMKDPYWIAFKPEDKYEDCSQRGIMGVEVSNKKRK